MRRCIFISLPLSLIASSVSDNTVTEASEMLNKFEYRKAYNILFKLAEKNDADAQYHLAVMYVKGKGVPQNFVKPTNGCCFQICRDLNQLR